MVPPSLGFTKVKEGRSFCSTFGSLRGQNFLTQSEIFLKKFFVTPGSFWMDVRPTSGSHSSDATAQSCLRLGSPYIKCGVSHSGEPHDLESSPGLPGLGTLTRGWVTSLPPYE